MSGIKSLRSRVNSAMRRSTSAFSISRPSTPLRADSASDAGDASSIQQPMSDSGSLKQLDTAPEVLAPPKLPLGVTAPSPIAESPAREAAAIAAEQNVSSPLAHGITAESETALPASEPIDADVGETAGYAAANPEATEPPAEPGTESWIPVLDESRAQEPLSVADGAGAFFDLPAPRTIEPPQYGAQVVEEPLQTDAVFGESAKEEEAVPGQVSASPDAFRTDAVSLDLKPSDASSKAPNVSPYADTHAKLSAQPSRVSLSGSGIWGAKPEQTRATPVIAAGGIPTAGTTNWGFGGDLQMPTEDPFADPNQVHIPSSGHHMPMPNHQEGASQRGPYMDAHSTVAMPLPMRDDVMGSKSMRNNASAYSLGNGSGRPVELDTDETRPLLSRPSTPQAYLRPTVSNSTLLSPNPSSSQVSTDILRSLGWLEYALPDGSVYYMHPTLRVTTDIDLRSNKKLQAVGAYFNDDEGLKRGKGVGKGCEIWLRDPSAFKGRFKPVRMLVDHKTRSVIPEANVRNDEEDRLDQEYRYWSFMEAHPAHAALPMDARSEAMDALTWSYTDRLLPSQRPVPPPFSQNECQELMNLLRSFDGTSPDSSEPGLQSIVHTRIVSRILLRVSHWRQAHFRPERPLPRDGLDHRKHGRRVPFRRAILDFMISCLCLGIPYIFMSRSHHHRTDEESGLRSAGPVLVIGASACLVAGVILSASVTFVSLPGLDSISRVAGLVAIMCATGTMVSSVVALMRYKLDLERDLAVGGEGLTLLTRRTVMLSLPLVFLAYALVALVTGVVLYSFRGVTVTNPGAMTRQFHFIITENSASSGSGCVSNRKVRLWYEYMYMLSHLIRA